MVWDTLVHYQMVLLDIEALTKISIDNLTKVKEKGMSEFKVGDVVKNGVTCALVEVLCITPDNALIRYVKDGGTGYNQKGKDILINKNCLETFTLANDEWKAYQEQQKAKEESKAVVAILKELANKIEMGEVILTTFEKKSYSFSTRNTVSFDWVEVNTK